MADRNLVAALEYLHKYQFSVIPVNSDKKPLIKWEEYQKRLASEVEVRKWWQTFPNANVGIVTGGVSKLCVFDTDDESADRFFNELLPDQTACPVVVTPRGGKHYYFRCPDDKISNKAMIRSEHLDFRGNGGYVVAAPSVNGNGRAYRFLPECHIKNVPIPALPADLLSLFNNNVLVVSDARACGDSMGTPWGDMGKKDTLFARGRRDADLFSVANALTKGGMKDESILQVLENIAKSWGEEHLASWFEDKIKSAIKRKEHREVNIMAEVRRYISLGNRDISLLDCYKTLKELQSVTTVIKRDNIRQAFHRLKAEGYIKAGARDGWYIRIDNLCEDMDIENVSTETHPLKMPVDLRKWVKIMPKNIIILAGAKSSGKTAFLLNTAFQNRNHKKGVYYYNSEMAVEELRIRLDCFGNDYPLGEWGKIKFKERGRDFADIIKQNPDAIHIIDFLEIYENFYEIGLPIKDIFDALGKGIAIVAIQKNVGVELGLGGARSIEKARLYLSLDRGRIKIIDAKLFEQRNINPRGWILNYKLTDGCHYFPDAQGWHEEEENLNFTKREGAKWRKQV